jgi:Rab proteins geranylgeranyltransferase component A
LVANSFKLGKSLQSFVPKEKLEIICKLGYVQSTFVNLDLSNQMFPTSENNVSLDTLRDAEDIVFTNMPSAEISYDGVVSDCRTLFTRITGSEDDFFDVDFEDEEFDEGQGSTSVSEAVKNGDILMKDHENAIEDSDSDDDRHGPFGTDLMEL